MAILRQTLRSLAGARVFTITALATLALAIGANTTVFSLLYQTMLAPLPFRAPDRLVRLWEKAPGGKEQNVLSPANFQDWTARSKTLAATAAWTSGSDTLGGEQAEPVISQYVTANFFDVLGIAPSVGTGFREADGAANGPRVGLISDRLYARRYGRDPRLIGKPIAVNGEAVTILGVLAPDTFTMGNARCDLWLPLRFTRGRDYRRSSGRYLNGVGRLAPGATVAAVQSELATIAAQLEREYPSFNAQWGVTVLRLQEQFAGPVRKPLYILGGAVFAMLLIACANLANLFLARQSTRMREFAIRSSLGASRLRLLLSMAAEGSVLSIAGAGLGLLLGSSLVDGLKALKPRGLPRLESFALDPASLAISIGLALFCTLAFCLAPALAIRRLDLSHAVRSGSGGAGSSQGANRFRAVLVIAQTAIALVLLTGAGLLARSFLKLQAVDPGFRAEGVLAMDVSAGGPAYRDRSKVTQFYARATEEIRALPGVEAASAITFLPFGGPGAATKFEVIGRPPRAAGDDLITDVRIIQSDYLKTMRISLLEGREFDRMDFNPSAPLRFLVNRAMAREVFRGETAIGKHITVSMGSGDPKPGEIVGVVGDTMSGALDEKVRPMVYYPHAQLPIPFMSFVVRSKNPLETVPGIKETLHRIDPGVPVSDTMVLSDYVGRSLSQRRFQSLLLGGFSGLALVLSLTGLAAVLLLFTLQKRKEMGIRLALGARPGSLIGSILGQGLRMVAIGLGIGVLGALAVTKYLKSELYEVSAMDPLTFVGTCLVLLLGASLASLGPARTAATTDPLVALREE